MSDWRIGRGWSESEMRQYLQTLSKRRVNFEVPLEAMTEAEGWTKDGAETWIGREPPGAPVADGFFRRARQAIVNYDFSDPRIVVGHFDPKTPLVGRDMLLELKVLGLRYLSGVRVHSVREEVVDGVTYFGFRYDTLEGHIERGFEWFLLTKQHATGDIHFHIAATWRLGDFPNWWTRLGFLVIGERFREAWRHRAPDRLKQLAREPAPTKPVAKPGHLAHRGDAEPERSAHN